MRQKCPPPWPAALLAALVLLPATCRAVDRYWVFTSACASADWFGKPDGSGSCWAASAGGAPGASLPTLGLDARIVESNPKATLRVPFAGPSRTAPTAVASSLLLQGSASFAAGLTIDRGGLDVGELRLGSTGQAGLGLLEQTGGEVVAKQLKLLAGRLDLAGGSLATDSLMLHSQQAGARLTMTGGQLDAAQLSLASTAGQEAAFVQQGGTVSGTQATLGAVKGTVPVTWTLSDAAATASLTGSVVVGDVGDGSLVLLGGARLAAGTLVVGSQAGITGAVQVGDGSALRTGALTVGGLGHGTVTLGRGSRFPVQSLVIGDGARSQGQVEAMEGATDLFFNSLVIGRAGSGRMDLRAASPLAIDAMIASALTLGQDNGGDGTLAMYATRLTTATSGSYVVGDHGNGLLQLTEGSSLDLPFGGFIVGQSPGGNGRVSLSGPGSRVLSAARVEIGHSGSGTLEVLDGASIDLGNLVLQMGTGAGSSGELSVRGGDASSPSRVAVRALAAAGPGANRIRIGSGGELVADIVTLGADSRLVLDGGTLRTTTLTLGPAQRLDWRAGTLSLGDSATMNDLQLPLSLNLMPGTLLKAGGGLTVAEGGLLTVAGGGFESMFLRLTSGARLAAQGQLASRVEGAAGSRIDATGALTLGSANQPGGFDHAGELWIGGHAVSLLGADAAVLGLSTRLADGGSLTAANGLLLPAGRAIASQGLARIVGALRNEGEVFALDGQLSFADRVGGNGAWFGNLRFESGFDPGDRQVDQTFAGDLEFTPSSWLRLDIVTAEPRLGHDTLGEIGLLSFEGELRLDFDPGFRADEGTRLQLLSFQAFTGHLDAGNVQVNGLPAWRVDVSRLAVDGSIAIAAVPEPGGGWLLLAGGAALALRRRAAQPPI
jgi:T5SS/PEP-CTERM-associated repeat protein